VSDLHKLVIKAPDGTVATASVTLDGQQLFCTSVTLRCNEGGSSRMAATIEFDLISVEFDGLADVVGKLTQAGKETS